jgi:hypothetical protein
MMKSETERGKWPIGILEKGNKITKWNHTNIENTNRIRKNMGKSN